jgi:hypothetical protein
MSHPPVAIPESESYRLRAADIDQEFEIRVARPIPGMMGPPGATYDVLYVLDGDLFFGIAVDMTRIMHQLYGELPPILVVGIGYGSGDPSVAGELRGRDFTPTTNDEFEQMGRRLMPDREPLLPEGQRLGGGHRFLSFLTGELAPLIGERYPVHGMSSLLWGSSLGGLFALYTLFTAPDAFDGFIVASPAIWWDDDHLFDVEERSARPDRARTRLFLGVGGLEEDERVPMLAPFRMVSNVEEMGRRLGGGRYDWLDSRTHVFADETHTSVLPAVLTRGLRFVLGPGDRRG